MCAKNSSKYKTNTLVEKEYRIYFHCDECKSHNAMSINASYQEEIYGWILNFVKIVLSGKVDELHEEPDIEIEFEYSHFISTVFLLHTDTS